MTFLPNLSLKIIIKMDNYVDNGLGNDKIRKETVMYAKKDIYLILIFF